MRSFARLNTKARIRMLVSGAGKFSVMMEERTRGDAQRLGAHRDARHDPAAVDRVSAARRGHPERIAARERRARGARRRQCAVRRRARHHARVRLHADRRRAGLSDSSAQSSPRGSRSGRGRAQAVADARYRRRQHVHRVLHLSILRRRRPAAARVLHRRRARSRGTHDAIPVAAAHELRARRTMAARRFCEQTWRAFARVPRPRELAAALCVLCSSVARVRQDRRSGRTIWRN